MEFQQHFIDYIEESRRKSIDSFFVEILQWRKSDYVNITLIPTLEITPVNVVKKDKKVKDSPSIVGFIYTKQKENPEAITDLMNCLKKNNFIDINTSISDFKHLFTGKVVENPIRWTTYLGGLLDLFRQLNEHKLIEYEGNSIYKIVCTCFVDEDGNKFDEAKFKYGKPSKNIHQNITKAVKLMR